MANYVSKVKLGSTTYFLKDSEVRAAVSALETAVASSLVFKGVIASAAGITGLTNYQTGWTYKASAGFAVNGLGTVENGDMIVCIAGSASYKPSDWTIVQNNVDTMSGATASNPGVRGLVPAPAAGEQNKFLSGNGTWQDAATAVEWGRFTELV